MRVVLPASGWEMMAKVRLRAISRGILGSVVMLESASESPWQGGAPPGPLARGG